MDEAPNDPLCADGPSLHSLRRRGRNFPIEEKLSGKSAGAAVRSRGFSPAVSAHGKEQQCRAAEYFTAWSKGIEKALLADANKCVQRNPVMRADSFSSSLRGGPGFLQSFGKV